MSEAKQVTKEQAATAVLGMTPEQLTALITAIRQPVVSEQEKVQKEQDQAMRRQQSELVIQEQKNKAARQKSCTHMRFNGTTRAVYVENGNYLICQRCQGIIRPNEEPEKFDRLFQILEQMSE